MEKSINPRRIYSLTKLFGLIDNLISVCRLFEAAPLEALNLLGVIDDKWFSQHSRRELLGVEHQNKMLMIPIATNTVKVCK